jgi:hypothetical protein
LENKHLQCFAVQIDRKSYDFEGKLHSNISKEVYYAYSKRHLYNILKELGIYEMLVSKKTIKIIREN